MAIYTLAMTVPKKLVKRIEISDEEVNIVFRIKELPKYTTDGTRNLQHCYRCHS